MSLNSSAESARQLEMGLAAATGHTSAEIARRYFVSLRTVDNHLGAVYRKLGLRGRDDLREFLTGAGAIPDQP